MRATSHKVAGACSALIVASFMFQGDAKTPATYIAIAGAFAGGVLGGLLPDIDHPESTMGRRLKPLSHVINTLFGHRGFTHTLFAWLLTSYFLFVLSGWIPMSVKGYVLAVFSGVIVGYMSHLLLDMLTVSGVPLLYPLSKKTLRFARLRTGRDDWIVTSLTLIITAVFLYYTR